MTATAIVLGVAVIAYLALFDPTAFPAPKCVFHSITGYDCPGCGSQRAVHALCHGRVADAWGYNPAIFFAVPLAALYAVSPRRLNKIMYARTTLIAIAASIVAWWILRNLM